MDWQERAACREPGVDPDWFFSTEDDIQELAKRVCYGCPVRYDCLEYAKTSNDGRNEREGIWGGQYHGRVRRWERSQTVVPLSIHRASASRWSA